MIASAALQLALVSLATTAAALVAEAGFRRTRLSTRWAWLAAIALPPLLVAAALIPSLAALARHPTASAMVVIPIEGIVVGSVGGAGGWAPLADAAVAVAWATSCIALILLLLRGHLALVRERRAWSRTSLIGGTVYSSLDRGPAVGGLMRPWIVVPAWVLRLPPRELRMVLVHEGQHVRAGDPRLLAGALALLALTPWNPISWWQLRRLRAAMEIDCDQRVLAQERDPRRYGSTLLTVAAQLVPERPLGLAAFSENKHSLRRRIVAMTARHTRWSRPIGVALLVLSVLVAVQACGVYGPTQPYEEEAIGTTASPGRAQTVALPPEPEGPPTASEATEPPEPMAAREPTAAPVLGPAPEPGAPGVPPTAPPEDTPAQPSAADVVRGLQSARAAPTPEPEPQPQPQPPPPPTRDLGSRPIFTPFTVAPTLTNRVEVGAALEREYPALLREAGVGGRVEVWIRIDERGEVMDAQVITSSGQPALDAAAVRVARVMRFTPAMNRDQVVPVWVSIPIQFQLKAP